MINLGKIRDNKLSRDPYEWAFISNLYSPRAEAELAATFPTDHFKTMVGNDGEKDWTYESRCLLGFGNSVPSHPWRLSRAWRELATDLASTEYREAMSKLTGIDLMSLWLEANVFHFGPGAWLGPHVDRKDKIVTQVLYFNDTWERKNGGCLAILRSSDLADEAAEILPTVGNSCVLVRSASSWHAVKPVAANCRNSRRSVTVTFYPEGTISPMWPPNENAPLHDYRDPDEKSGALTRLKRWFATR